LKATGNVKSINEDTASPNPGAITSLEKV
jgi:hypothetical protein